MWFAVEIAVDNPSALYSVIGRAGVSLAVPRVRLVFSESMKDIQLDDGSPNGRRVLSHASKVGGGGLVRVLFDPLARTLKSIASDLACVFMPSDCRVCGAAFADASAARVCRSCVDRLQPDRDTELDPLCTRCGDALGMESARFNASRGVSECTMCRLAPPAFDRAVSFASYDSEMREMLHLLKFNGRRSIARHVLGTGMAAAIQKLRAVASNDLLVIPVPLFFAKQRERGFNQSTLLASAALRHLCRTDPGWHLLLQAHALIRTRDTRALYNLDPSQRRSSLRGAFRVSEAAAVQGREVLLIDDIMTTGATARECARVLKRAGATRVWVATAAKARPESARSVVRHDAATLTMWDAPAPLPRMSARPGISSMENAQVTKM